MNTERNARGASSTDNGQNQMEAGRKAGSRPPSLYGKVVLRSCHVRRQSRRRREAWREKHH